MPIFEYACPQCGHAFEKLVLTRHHEPPECPQCGWKKVDRKFSTFATTGPANRIAAAACAPAGGG